MDYSRKKQNTHQTPTPNPEFLVFLPLETPDKTKLQLKETPQNSEIKASGNSMIFS